MAAAELYHVGGKSLGCIQAQDQLVLGGVKLQATVDLNRNQLRLGSSTITDTRQQELKRVIEARDLELSQRRNDLKAVTDEFNALVAELSKGNDVSAQMAPVAALKAQHSKRI